MATCDCCGCVFASDYGTSIITGEGSRSDPYVVSVVENTWIRPSARVRRTTTQSIATGAAFVPISFDTKIFDTGNFWTVSTPTLFTIPKTGMYIFGGCGQWAANATGTRELGFRLNGSTILLVNDQPVDTVNGVATTPWSAASYQKTLAVGQTLELVMRQESGGALNVQPEADDSIVFWIVYAGQTV